MTGADEQVTVFEVGPRDGLQNEDALIPVSDKVALIDLLSQSGLRHIEAGSFVSPRWVPQMADTDAVMEQITRTPGISYPVLTPNIRGFEAAQLAKADSVAVFLSASESFSQKNINCSIEESFERISPVLAAARTAQIPVRGYVSCVVECPYEGAIAPSAVAEVSARLFETGCYEISLGDTIGAGQPDTIDSMLSAVLTEVPASDLAGHYHDTGQNALANVELSLEHGLRVFDSAVGGLGGCPYAPGAKGNLATGALVSRLEELGYRTGVDLDKLAEAEVFVAKCLGRDLNIQGDQHVL